MIDEAPSRRSATIAVKTDPYQNRRAELQQIPARERVSAIEADLKKVAHMPTTRATFHRKKLLRMHDAARLEAGLVSPARLQRENSPFSDADFVNARIVWKSRSLRA